MFCLFRLWGPSTVFTIRCTSATSALLTISTCFTERLCIAPIFISAVDVCHLRSRRQRGVRHRRTLPAVLCSRQLCEPWRSTVRDLEHSDRGEREPKAADPASVSAKDSSVLFRQFRGIRPSHTSRRRILQKRPKALVIPRQCLGLRGILQVEIANLSVFKRKMQAFRPLESQNKFCLKSIHS